MNEDDGWFAAFGADELELEQQQTLVFGSDPLSETVVICLIYTLPGTRMH